MKRLAEIERIVMETEENINGWGSLYPKLIPSYKAQAYNQIRRILLGDSELGENYE